MNNATTVSTRRNTEICVDLKTILLSDPVARKGKRYCGLLTRDAIDHFTFCELTDSPAHHRNPRVFCGRYITVTQWDDGSLHPNFRPTSLANVSNRKLFATMVALELHDAFESLVEKAR